MNTAIISKEQAKFARYLANKAFGKKGIAKNVDGKKERTYIMTGCCLIWTEATVAEGIEAQVIKAVWRDVPHSEGMLAYDQYHMDFMSAVSILGGDGEPKPHQDLADAVTLAVEHLAQEAEPPAEDVPAPQPEAHIDYAFEGPDVHIAAEAKPLSVREKLDRCAAMRLAHDFSYPLDTPFKEIVEKEGTPAVLRYQEILQRVPLHGLTEARLKFAFPVEYASL